MSNKKLTILEFIFTGDEDILEKKKPKKREIRFGKSPIGKFKELLDGD